MCIVLYCGVVSYNSMKCEQCERFLLLFPDGIVGSGQRHACLWALGGSSSTQRWGRTRKLFQKGPWPPRAFKSGTFLLWRNSLTLWKQIAIILFFYPIISPISTYFDSRKEECWTMWLKTTVNICVLRHSASLTSLIFPPLSFSPKPRPSLMSTSVILIHCGHPLLQ